jgi:TrmH family RNA methyltransferase
MPATPHITSPQNPRIKAALRLRHRHHRDEAGLTLLEGFRALSRALACGMPVQEVLFCPALFLGGNEAALLATAQARGAALTEVADPVLRRLAYRDRPEGLIAVARMRAHPLAALPVAADGLYLVAEAIEKPGNLGSLLRSADAAGVAGLIVCDPRTDLYNPNVVTASTGALFSVPIAVATPDETRQWLSSGGILSVAATPHADLIHTEADLSGGVAIVVGAEQHGLSAPWLDGADIRVRIPMLGLADSLNVATAATILLYEAARQRGWRRPASCTQPGGM